MRLITFLAVCFVSVFSARTYAYPQFIGYGYNSCITCHYNPYGNGPLNDYGRALSATTISDRLIHKPKTNEEEIGENSGFLYRKPFNSWFRPSVNYRGLGYTVNLGDKSSKTEWINMVANVNTVFRLLGDDRLIVSLTLGYAPTPKSLPEETNFRSREHYIGYRPNNDWGFYLGLMDKVFGIRIPDHQASSRSTTNLAQNDQAYGALIHLSKYNFEVGLFPFVGNLQQDKLIRQRGFSTKIEYNVSHKFKPGVSFLKSNSDITTEYIMAFHTKAGFSKGSAILLEIGKIQKEVKVTKEKKNSLYGLLQGYILLRRGTFLFLTADYSKQETSKNSHILKFGPGFQYFPSQGFELRFDLYNTKTLSPDESTEDRWDFAGQVHLWF